MKHNIQPAQHRIVLGPSSVGKSTYISNLLDRGMLSIDTEIILAYDLERRFSLARGNSCLIHYNLLRPFENDIKNFPASILRDPLVDRLFDPEVVSGVDMLVARRATIAKRVLLRKVVEPKLGVESVNYPWEMIYEFISSIELVEFYEPWFSFLGDRGIPMRFISTEDESYTILPSVDVAKEVLTSTEAETYSEAERHYVLSRFKFPYQGLEGADCDRTLRLIKPFLQGSSLLDVGCAEGFFCFEAERLGFAEVFGIDIKRDRFLAACAYRDVTGSGCEFRLRDALTLPNDKSFDVVLVLNVLHHLEDPIGALRILAGRSRNCLIIEYPTLSDPKFSATVGRSTHGLNDLPLVGVSLLDEKDQTFVFTDSAIRRLLLDNMKAVRGIEFFESPRAVGRRIAICKI